MMVVEVCQTGSLYHCTIRGLKVMFSCDTWEEVRLKAAQYNSHPVFNNKPIVFERVL